MFTPLKKISAKNWKLLGNGYGFFIFLIISIGSMLGYSFYLVLPTLSSLQKTIFIIAGVLHLIMHWYSSLFFQTQKNAFILTFIQSILGLTVTFIVTEFQLSFAIFAALIGTASGALLSLRFKVGIILWYAGLLGVSARFFGEAIALDLWWATIISTTFIIFIFAIAFDMQNRVQAKSEKLLSELGQAHTELANYAAQVETLTLENERQRIARELHDTLAQGLAGIILNLEAISSQIERKDDVRAQEILQQSMQNARSTLAEARNVIDDLRSFEQRAINFETQLKVAVAHFEAAAQVPSEVQMETKIKLENEQQIELIRIVNEVLNNVQKHANAKKVQLNFSAYENDFILSIQDDGRGFSPEGALQKEGSYGLLGIQERVDLLHGTLQIISQPRHGTEIRVTIPKLGGQA